jgi:hypothetical protein
MTALLQTLTLTRTRRRLALAGAIVLGLILLAVIALQVATRQLQAEVALALGPRASIGAIRPGWTGIDVLDLRIQGPAGWPVADELRASRVRITPDPRSLFGGPWRIAQVRVEGAYLAVLRTRDGKTRVLPSLLEKPQDKTKPASSATSPAAKPDPLAKPLLTIGRVALDGAQVEFFDSSVRQPALRLTLDQVDADVGPLVLPQLDKPLQVQLDGVFKGVQRDGRIRIDGDYTVASRDADIRARFNDVDLVTLQPYLLKVADKGIKRGTLDLDLRANVVRNQLKAPGKLTLTGLEFASDGALSTFAGVPRQAVLAAMSKDGKLEVKFTLEGRLDDPAFSLNENLATRIASGMAESLGVSLSGMVKGLGGMVKGLFGK